MEFDLFTLLPLAAAVFVFWKLRSVLGTRNGNEQPPYSPYEQVETQDAAAEGNDNVVTLPGVNRRSAEDELQAGIDRIAGDNKTLRSGLMDILEQDSGFDAEQFLGGAKMAYEMIVTAFADGDKRALQNLLSREVYENFEAVIDERAERGEVVKASFVGVENSELVGAEMEGDEAHVTVSFVSQIISATVDKDDNVVDGDLNEVAEVTDVWTFARSVTSRDPNWKLVATDE